MMCTLPDYILKEFHENIDKVRVLKYYMLIGDDVEITWFVF